MVVFAQLIVLLQCFADNSEELSGIMMVAKGGGRKDREVRATFLKYLVFRGSFEEKILVFKFFFSNATYINLYI